MNSQQEIGFEDIFNFLKEFYKEILIISLLGCVMAIIVCMVLGVYTATITLNNYNGLDIPRIRYLQSALPKLAQEVQKIKKNEADEFLGKEDFWTKNIKPTILVSKADSKELLDATALNAAGSKISSIQIIGKAPSKEIAEKNAERARAFFIDGSTYIDLRDLIRGYELKVISIESNLLKKINSAEVELDYLQKRIKNLNELKGQYPATTTSLGQVVDAKDSGAKYLPITTQIVAATTDANNLKESLERYKDEENQNTIYKLFVEKAKPLIENEINDSSLAEQLLDIANKIEKDVTGSVKQVAIEDIKVSLSTIQTNKVYGLKQIGIIDVGKPSYLKYLAGGLFAGLIAGLLRALGLQILKKRRKLDEVNE